MSSRNSSASTARLYRRTLHVLLTAASLLIAPAAAHGQAQTCKVVFRMVTNVGVGNIGWSVNYATPSGEFSGEGPDVECESPLEDVLFAAFDADGNRKLNCGVLSTETITGSAIVAECLFSTTGTAPTPGDFPITVTEAGDEDGVDILPLPVVEIASIDCCTVGDECCEDGGSCTTTTTTTSTTSTTLPLEHECEIVFGITSTVDVGNIGWTVSYASADGDFVGEGAKVKCDLLVDDAFFEAFDNEPAERLQCGLLSVEGVESTSELSRCRFLSSDAPSAGDFEIAVTEASDPSGEEIEPLPSVVISEVDCDDEVCGNHVVGGQEDCDDGDTLFGVGDFCGPDCRRVPCGKPTNSPGALPTASDALFMLRTSVGLVVCDPRVCDINASGGVTATDALAGLRAAVGQPINLHCWSPA